MGCVIQMIVGKKDSDYFLKNKGNYIELPNKKRDLNLSRFFVTNLKYF